MKHSILPRLFLLIIFPLSLIACNQNTDSAASVVEDYLHALVNKNADQLIALSCSDWETNATGELNALAAVKTELSAVSCQTGETNDNVALVTCTGHINATYDNEDQVVELASRTYRVIREGGEWRMCGYEQP
jgi:hypothetical protein